MTARHGRPPHFAARLAVVCGLVLVCACVVACAPPFPQQGPGGEGGDTSGEGPGGRRQPLALSPEQELKVGHKAYQEVMHEYAGRVLPDGDPEVRRVRHVLEKIHQAAEIEPLQREINLRLGGYKFDWDANVIRDRQINAFCLPAAEVFVFTGILKVTGDDDAELAAVLGHEAAHALAHHASERMAVLQDSGDKSLGALKYGRMQESEADHIGVFLMAFAGYDPNKAVEFWRRMEQATADQQRPPEILSDHPSPERRIHDLSVWARDARDAKDAWDRRRIQPPRSAVGR